MNDLETKIELAVEWIDALCADEFKQTRGTMKNFSGYCCLGVYRKVAHTGGKDVDILEPFEADSLGMHYYIEPGHTFIVLPGLQGDEYIEALPTLNDENELTFPEIAAVVLSNLDMVYQTDVAYGIKEHYFGGEV